MRLLNTFIFVLFLMPMMNAQKLRFVGGVGGGIFRTNSSFFQQNEKLAVSFSGSNENLFPTLEAYIEKTFAPYFSVRAGINAWQFRTNGVIQSSPLSSQAQFVFQGITSDFKNWGIPMTLNFKIKNWQIIGGLGYNFVVSSLKPTASVVFFENPEAQELAANYDKFYKKRFFSSYFGVSYQVKMMVFELKFIKSVGSIGQKNFGDLKASGANLSVFFQFDFNEN